MAKNKKQPTKSDADKQDVYTVKQVVEAQDNSASAAGTKHKPGRFVAFVAAIVLAVIIGLSIGYFTGSLITEDKALDSENNTTQEQATETDSDDEGGSVTTLQTDCEHSWRSLGLFEQADAVTHTEEYPEITEVIQVSHTVCNTCYALVDGETEAHTEATGHEGFTTDVPIDTTVVTQEAYSEEVVDEQASVSFTPIFNWCATCGTIEAILDAETLNSSE